MTAACRLPSHQGIFYPAEPQVLQQQLDYLLASDTPATPEKIKALIVPHAAYDYSGRVAGQAYATLSQQTPFKRIVILAPNHQNSASNALICSHEHWATPLGESAIDQAFTHQHWAGQPGVSVDDETHQAEYSIEVQLPFLQRILPDVPIVPVLLGAGDPTHLRHLLQPLWDDPDTLIMVSSDLYHYLPRQAALQAGIQTARLIENNDYKNLQPEQACGYIALREIMALVKQNKYFWRTLAVQHSGQDNRFGASTYVGYGAFLLLEKTGKVPLS